jgi:hypothetical protein
MRKRLGPSEDGPYVFYNTCAGLYWTGSAVGASTSLGRSATIIVLVLLVVGGVAAESSAISTGGDEQSSVSRGQQSQASAVDTSPGATQLCTTQVSGTQASSSATRLAPNITTRFIPPAVDRQCEQQIGSVKVLALRARVTRFLKRTSVPDADVWSRAIAKSLCAAEMPLSPEYFALFIALIAKESSFNADGLLPEQPDALKKIAHRLIEKLYRGDPRSLKQLFGRRGAAELVPVALGLLRKTQILDASMGKEVFDNYYDKYGWQRIKTERDVETILVDDVCSIAQSPTALGFVLRALFEFQPQIKDRLNRRSVFKTIGPLQVSLAQARQLAEKDGLMVDEPEMRKILYNIDGGVYYGTRRLKSFVEIYTKHLPLDASTAGFIASDYSGGRYAARNAAVASQIARLRGVKVPRDNSPFASPVREAMNELASEMLAANDAPLDAESVSVAVKTFISSTSSRNLERNALYRFIKERYRLRFGEEPAYGQYPLTCFTRVKGGSICHTDIARSVSRKYKAACDALGCPTIRNTDSGEQRASAASR